jgi:DNA-binding IclR family transcriptional regulator
MTIKAVEKAIDILNCFTPDKPLLGVNEISEAIGLTPSTVSRILATLHKKGCVDKDPATGRYKLGFTIYRWGLIMDNQLPNIALPVMEKVRDACGEEAALFVLQGNTRTCIAKAESRYSVAKSTALGTTLPLHCGAAGKVLLAYQPNAVRSQVLSSPLKKYTPHTITDPDKLEAELAKIRSQGFAYSAGEREIGAYSIVAPVWDSFGRVVASLVVSGPEFRLTEEKRDEYIKLVIAAAKEISHKLGYREES